MSCAVRATLERVLVYKCSASLQQQLPYRHCVFTHIVVLVAAAAAAGRMPWPLQPVSKVCCLLILSMLSIKPQHDCHQPRAPLEQNRHLSFLRGWQWCCSQDGFGCEPVFRLHELCAHVGMQAAPI
jgi:hypothetical protein